MWRRDSGSREQAGNCRVRRSAPGPNHLNNVSCTSNRAAPSAPAVLCAVTDDDGGNVAVSTTPWKASSWMASGNVLGYPPGYQTQINGISCPNTSTCVGLVGGIVFFSTAPNGGSWDNYVAAVNNEITGASCPSVSLCVLSDNFGNAVFSSEPTGGAGAWHVTNLGGGEAGAVQPQSTAIACPSVTLCVMAGTVEYSGGSGPFGDAMFTSEKPTGGASSWKAAILVPSQQSGFQSISCPSTHLCIAVSAYSGIWRSTNPAGGVAAWKSIQVAGASYFNSVSCPSVHLCVATDAYNQILTSRSAHLAGKAGTWSVTTPTVGAGSPADVSCIDLSASKTLCVSTEGAGVSNILWSTNPTGGASAWTEGQIPVGRGLESMWCTTGPLCVAVDQVSNVLTSTSPAKGVATWSLTPADFLATNLTAVTCADRSFCLAGDFLGNVIVGRAPKS